MALSAHPLAPGPWACGPCRIPRAVVIEAQSTATPAARTPLLIRENRGQRGTEYRTAQPLQCPRWSALPGIARFDSESVFVSRTVLDLIIKIFSQNARLPCIANLTDTCLPAMLRPGLERMVSRLALCSLAPSVQAQSGKRNPEALHRRDRTFSPLRLSGQPPQRRPIAMNAASSPEQGAASPSLRPSRIPPLHVAQSQPS